MIAGSATFRSTMERDESAGWSNPKVLAIFAVIFLCGAMFGAVGMRAFLHARMPFSDQRAIESARRVPVENLARELNLTPEQKTAVMAQLDEYGKYYDNIEEEREDVAHHGVNSIMKILHEDQRKVFTRLFGAKR